MLIFSTFFEEIAKFSKNNSFNFHFPKKKLHKNGIYDKKSTILDVFVKIMLKIRQSKKKLGHKNKIKMFTHGIFQFFCQIGDPEFGINPGFGIHLLQTNWYSKIGVLLYCELAVWVLQGLHLGHIYSSGQKGLDTQ